MTTRTIEKKFPIAIYNHEVEAYWYVYSLEELIDFLNEHDDNFIYKYEPEEVKQ
jgi:hypothetical protein